MLTFLSLFLLMPLLMNVDDHHGYLKFRCGGFKEDSLLPALSADILHPKFFLLSRGVHSLPLQVLNVRKFMHFKIFVSFSSFQAFSEPSYS